MSIFSIGHKQGFDAASSGSAVLAGVAARYAVRGGWRLITGDDPPNNPATRDVSWGDALAWTAAVAVTVGVARLLARRSVVPAYERVTGTAAPV